MTPDSDPSGTGDLPPAVAAEAERLTRLARRVADPAEAAAYRDSRDELLAEHGFVARLREADDTLVCYPSEWVEEGTVRVDAVEETDRAAELPLSGPGDPDRWDEVAEHNAALVEQVAAEHGPVHAANARALADFFDNHYAKEIERATPAELEEFRTDYFRRNAWPSDEQRAVLDRSIRHVFAAAGVDVPD